MAAFSTHDRTSFMRELTEHCRWSVVSNRRLHAFLRAFVPFLDGIKGDDGIVPACFLVGGYVRDLALEMMCRRPVSAGDIDIVVTGLSDNGTEEIRSFLEEEASSLSLRGVCAVAGRFPVVKAFSAGGGGVFDIALARAHEVSTGPGHRDFRFVTYGVTLADDLRRRDFTVNALACEVGFRDDELFCRIVDVVNGIDDLAARRIAAIGDPLARYREDPIRQIRAIRFAAVLHDAGFSIEEKAFRAIAAVYPATRDDIPVEPLVAEAGRAFAADFPCAWRLMKNSGILDLSFPSLGEISPEIREKVTCMIAAAGAHGSGFVPWALIGAVLFMDEAAANFCRMPVPLLPRHMRVPSLQAWCRALRLPRETFRNAAALLTGALFQRFLWGYAVFEAARSSFAGEEQAAFVALCRALIDADGEDRTVLDAVNARCDEIPVPCTRRELKVFFERHGVESGPLRSLMLFSARDRQLREGHRDAGRFLADARAWYEEHRKRDDVFSGGAVNK